MRRASRSDGVQFLDALERLAEPDDLPLLVAACVGRVIYIPRYHRPSANHFTTLAIGQERANELVRKLQELGFTDHFDIPISTQSLMRSFQRAQAARIKKAIEAGLMTHEIAVQCGVTRRTVQLHRVEIARRKRLEEEGFSEGDR